MEKTALVLEGGGMRGVFTAGVLDYLLDHQIRFPYVIGVSAGACNALSYLSEQRGRAHASNIEMLEKYDYIGVKHLWTKRSIIDFDLLFEAFPEQILPYDYDTYFRSSTLLEMVTCNCLTGEPMYLSEKHDKKRLLQIARASSSLPFVCPIVMLDGIPMLDGGICDSIPVQRALNKGYERLVVVLTRNADYRKSEKKCHLPSFLYKKYPLLREQMMQRAKTYNKTLEQIAALQQEGRAVVIRPLKPIEVDRMERNVEKLEALYQEGYQRTSQLAEQLSVR